MNTVKRNALWSVTLAVLLCLSTATIVRADPGSDIICAEIDSFLSNITHQPVTIDHATCVACETVFNNDSHAGGPCFCKAFQDAGLLPALGFKNLGQCVSAIQSGNFNPFGATNLSVVSFSTLLMGWVAIQLWRRRRSASAV